MIEDDVKQTIKQAEEIVKDVPEGLKAVAFELAYKSLISKYLSGGDPAGKQYSLLGGGTETGLEKMKPEDGNEFYTIIANKTATDKMYIESIYSLDKDNKIQVNTASLNGTTAEKQRQLAYLYLFAKRVAFEEEWVSALEFAQQTSRYGINDGHVSANLGHDTGMILQRGSNRGKKYGLTPNGVVKAIDLIKQLHTK